MAKDDLTRVISTITKILWYNVFTIPHMVIIFIDRINKRYPPVSNDPVRIELKGQENIPEMFLLLSTQLHQKRIIIR